MLRVLILVAVVVGLAMWFLKSRRRITPPSKGAGQSPGETGKEAAAMVACAHCGVHLPKPDAAFDGEGRSYCGDAHRLAGPR